MGLRPHVALRTAHGAPLLNVIEIIQGAIKSAPALLDLLGFSKKTTPDYYRWG